MIGIKKVIMLILFNIINNIFIIFFNINIKYLNFIIYENKIVK